MSHIVDSLEANKAEILAACPDELRAEAEANLLKVVEVPILAGEAAIAAVKQELVDNPAVDESAAAEALADIVAPAQRRLLLTKNWPLIRRNCSRKPRQWARIPILSKSTPSPRRCVRCRRCDPTRTRSTARLRPLFPLRPVGGARE
jgi:hypothetical protein